MCVCVCASAYCSENKNVALSLMFDLGLFEVVKYIAWYEYSDMFHVLTDCSPIGYGTINTK